MKTLRDVKVGETATIARLHGEGALKRRIMDMGLTKGTETLNRMICQLTTGRPFVKELIHGGIELLLGILLLLDPLTAVAHHLFLLGIELVAVGLQAVQETKRAVAGEGA